MTVSGEIAIPVSSYSCLMASCNNLNLSLSVLFSIFLSLLLALQVPLFVAVYDSCVLIVSSDNLDGARPPSKHTVYCTLTGSVW